MTATLAVKRTTRKTTTRNSSNVRCFLLAAVHVLWGHFEIRHGCTAYRTFWCLFAQEQMLSVEHLVLSMQPRRGRGVRRRRLTLTRRRTRRKMTRSE